MRQDSPPPLRERVRERGNSREFDRLVELRRLYERLLPMALDPEGPWPPDAVAREATVVFSDLVGYSESEFQQAVWPPVMDRANLDKHREQMKDMLAGKIESADIKTGYVHAQGLLVPVVGTLTLVRENGEPSHFLLETS